MLSLSLAAKLHEDEEFKIRTNLAFNVIAHEVLAEPHETEHHVARANHANMVLQFPKSAIDNFVAGVIGSPSIMNSNVASSEQITDEQILEGVRQVWNSLIGIVDGD